MMIFWRSGRVWGSVGVDGMGGLGRRGGRGVEGWMGVGDVVVREGWGGVV